MLGPGTQNNNPQNTQSNTLYQNEQAANLAPQSQIGLPSYFNIKIDKASIIKAQGNQFFKQHQYEQARNKYQQALQLLQPSSFYGASQSQCHRMAQLSANLLFNVGTCFFNESKWKEAEMIYNQAITVNPWYTKALYKRAMARFHQNQYQSAMADIKTAYNLDKNNNNIREGYELIRQKYNQELIKDNEKRKELSSKIFSSSVNQKSQLNNEAKVKSQQKQNKASKKQSESKTPWWLLPLVPLAAIAVYQGFKYFKN